MNFSGSRLGFWFRPPQSALATVVSVLPGFTNGTWYINSLGSDSPSSADVSFIIRRNGTFALNFTFSINYVDPTGTAQTTGVGSTYPVIAGDWISPKTDSSGDAYWVRFSGKRNLNATNAFMNGYNSSNDSISPLLYSAQTNGALLPFNSGWLSLGTDKGLYHSNGGDYYGGETRLSELKIEISTDSAGSNIVSTTNAGSFICGTTSGGV